MKWTDKEKQRLLDFIWERQIKGSAWQYGRFIVNMVPGSTVIGSRNEDVKITKVIHRADREYIYVFTVGDGNHVTRFDFTPEELQDFFTPPDATAYMERRGIVEATQDGHTLIYYASYPLERTTYRVTVDLLTEKETSREPLKRYYRKGLANQGL